MTKVEFVYTNTSASMSLVGADSPHPTLSTGPKGAARRWALFALAAAVWGCGDELGRQGPAAASDTADLEQGLVCGDVPAQGIDGKDAMEPELYYPAVMNRLLENDAGLREGVGFERVTNCDQARHFTRVRNEMQDLGRYTPPVAPEVVDLPVDWQEVLRERGMPELGREIQAKAEDPELVDKVYNGTGLVSDTTVLFIDTSQNPNNTSYCSAVPVGKRFLSGYWWTTFLTSAHCAVNPGTYWPTYAGYYYYGGLKLYHTTQTGTISLWYSTVAHYVRYADWTGMGDYNNDFAFVSAAMGTYEYPASMLNRVAATWILPAVGVQNSGTRMSVRGFGPNTSTGNPTLRQSSSYFYIDAYTPWAFKDTNDGDVRICGGDSGGQAYFNATYAVSGITSGTNTPTYCAAAADEKRWTVAGNFFTTGWVQNFHGPGCSINNNLWQCW